MGDFATAWRRTSANEGGYSNDPRDPGGETYRGISRRWFPRWEGWGVVDEAKRAGGFPRSVALRLDAPVREFYREKFWDAVRGDRLPQVIADEAFDTAVNMSPVKAITFLQRALNVIAASRWASVDEDGQCGERTLRAVAACEAVDDLWLLEATMNDAQWAHYRGLMAMNPKLRVFARGWRARSLARQAASAAGEGVGVTGSSGGALAAGAEPSTPLSRETPEG